MLNAELQMFKSVSVTKPITADRLSVLPDLYRNVLSPPNAIALLLLFFQQVINITNTPSLAQSVAHVPTVVTDT